MNFNKNTDFIPKRRQSRLACLQKLRSLTSMLLFYALSTEVVLNQFRHFRSCAGLEA